MQLPTVNLLGSAIATTSMGGMIDEIARFAETRQPAYVCFATAHMIVESTRKTAVRTAYQNASVIAPDGVPIGWCARNFSGLPAECISGPRLMPALLERAQQQGFRVGFYGGRSETLGLLHRRIKRDYPKLHVNYIFSPPFGPLSEEQQETHLAQIRAAGLHLLLVGLGSPRQECWMCEFSPKLDCVCLGVGAAFEFFSGEKVLPPDCIQRLGLNWLVRLFQEPRRLFVRNLYSPFFVVKAMQWALMSESSRMQWQRRIHNRFAPPALIARSISTNS